MSCNLKTVAHFEVPVDLQKWLCPHLTFSAVSTPGQNNPFDAFPDGAWEDNWGGWDPNEGGANTDQKSGVAARPAAATQPTGAGSSSSEQCWLAECLVSVSPAGDVVAVAREDRLCVLTGVWEMPEDEEERLVLRLSWKGILETNVGSICSVMCLPVSSLQRSSVGCPDFTSLLVCYETGPIRWYTQSGVLLLGKQFEEPGVGVVSAELRTATPDGSELLALLYPRSVVTIDTRQMTTILRLSMSKLAKASAGGEPVNSSSHSPFLPYKRWQLQGHSPPALKDVSIAGPTNECLYDALAQASLTQSSFSRDSIMAGIYGGGVTLMAAGAEPYVAMLVGRELQAAVHVSDVAKQLASAVTSKILGSASSWLPFVSSKPANEKVQEKIEPGIPAPYRWSLPEGRRAACSVSVSPDPRLAAVTDTFGRIVLVDVRGGYALRMWKGYRDAVVGWLSVSGVWSAAANSSPGYFSPHGGAAVPDVTRRALFLVVHAPRRGLLEVWPAQHGNRVAAFNVPKNARLLYTSYGMLGGGASNRLYSLLLLCPDGAMQQLTVPFHLILGGRTGRRARDLHLYKSFKSAVKRGRERDAAKLCSELHTTTVRLQVLTFLAYSPCMYTDFLLRSVLATMLPLYLPDVELTPASSVASTPDLSGEGGAANPPPAPAAPHDVLKDKDAAKVQVLLKKLHQLLQLHSAIYALHPQQGGDDADPAGEPSRGEDEPTGEQVTELCHRLLLSPTRLHQLLDEPHQRQSPSTKVTFSESTTAAPDRVRVNVAWFLRSFDLGVSRERPQEKLGRAQLLLRDLTSRTVERPDTARSRIPGGSSAAAEPAAAAREEPVTGILPIPLQDQLASDRKTALGRFLFGWSWSGSRCAAVHQALLESGVDAKGLLKLLLLHWHHEAAFNTCSSSSSSGATPAFVERSHSQQGGSNAADAGGCASQQQTVKEVDTGQASCDSSRRVSTEPNSASSSTNLPEVSPTSGGEGGESRPPPSSGEEGGSRPPPTFTLEQLVRVTATLKMAALLASLTSMKEEEVQCLPEDHSSWWSNVRTRLASWSRIKRAYLFALASRAINTKMEARLERLEQRWRLLQHELQKVKEEEEGARLEQREKEELDDAGQDGNDREADSELPAPGVSAGSSSRAATASPIKSANETSSPAGQCSDLFTELNSDIRRAVSAGDSGALNSLLEWEGCTMEASVWAAILGQLEKLLPLERLLNLSLSQWKGGDCDLTLKMLIDKGKGGVSEAVSRWLVRTGLSAEDLCTLTLNVDLHVQHRKRLGRESSEESPEQQQQREEQGEDQPSPEEQPLLHPQDVAAEWHPDLLLVYEHLLEVSASFPESTCLASLQPHLAWESAAAWQHNTHDVRLLQHAATLAAAIPNSHVKHGVCVLVWEKWVSSCFRRVSELMERVAGLPSSSHCQSKLRLPRHCLASFLAACRCLLNLIMQSNVKCEVEKARIPNVDRFWQHIIVDNTGLQEQREKYSSRGRVAAQQQQQAPQDPDQAAQSRGDRATAATSIYDGATAAEPLLHRDRFIDRQGGADGRPDTEDTSRKRRVLGPKSLVEVAVLQKVTSYDLAFVHLQLADALSLIAMLDMKPVKPYSFFNDRCRCVLHKSLHLQWQLGSVDEAASVTTLRIRFLTSAITHAIAALSDTPSWNEFTKSGCEEVIALGQLWGVGTDHLYRFQVIELYSFGHDQFAKERVSLVSSPRQLGQNLLLLAACRFKYLMDSSQNPVPFVVALGASLGHWIKSLNAEQLKNPRVPVTASVELLQTTLRLLPPTSADHDKADALIYAFQTVQQLPDVQC